MISRANRFHGHRSVGSVRGAVLHDKAMSLRYARNNRSDYRLAVVVSKKVAAHAVVRNRIRRRLFELIRTQKSLNGVAMDAVIYVKNDKVATMPAEALSKEMAALTKKALARL